MHQPSISPHRLVLFAEGEALRTGALGACVAIGVPIAGVGYLGVSFAGSGTLGALRQQRQAPQLLVVFREGEELCPCAGRPAGAFINFACGRSLSCVDLCLLIFREGKELCPGARGPTSSFVTNTCSCSLPCVGCLVIFRDGEDLCSSTRRPAGSFLAFASRSLSRVCCGLVPR